MALNYIIQQRILENLGQLVGSVKVNRAAKSTRRKVLPLGLFRPVTINCHCIPEDNKEVEQILEKNDEKRLLRLVYLRNKDEQVAYKIRKKRNICLVLEVEFIVLGCMQYLTIRL